MDLKFIRGLEQAKKELYSVDPLDEGSLPDEVMEKTIATFGERLSPRSPSSASLRTYASGRRRRKALRAHPGRTLPDPG